MRFTGGYMRRKLFLVPIILGLLQFGAFAQSFDRITQILDAKEINAGQLSYLAATYLNVIDERSDEKAAFDKLKEMGYFDDSFSADSPVSLKKVCAVFARAADIKGGFMYRLTKKSERYAYKEFLARGYIPVNSDPSMHVSGVNAVALFNSILEENSK